MQSPADILAQVEADLRQGGTLSRRLPTYEERPAQIAMARLVTEALFGGETAMVEAPTGVGKSLAYLIPVVRSGKVAIVSTANKALQEQLFYKDIPFLQEYLHPFDAALVKGVGNYICLDRFNKEHQFQLDVQDPQFDRLLEALKDPNFDGDIESLPFHLQVDMHRRVCGDSDQCAWIKCAEYGHCFIRSMRERAKDAQIIVVNHTLLLLDILSEGHILPKRDVIILDEGHHLDEEATKVFTTTVSHGQIMTLLSLRAVQSHAVSTHVKQASTLAGDLWEQLEQCFQDQPEGKKIVLREAREEGLQLASALEAIHGDLLGDPPAFETEAEEILYKKVVQRTVNLAGAIRKVFSVDDPDTVYYMELKKRSKSTYLSPVEVSAAPLDVSHLLAKNLFDRWPVIVTSATLASTGSIGAYIEPTFDYFRRRTGLMDATCPQREAILPSPFDYRSSALLYVPRPTEMPSPAYGSGPLVDAYVQAIAQQMERLVFASGGSAFLLFSSKRMQDTIYEQISGRLPFPILRQGEYPRGELLRLFREQEGSVLFGLKSFWEGVDIAGSALSLVVIDKLPFDPPDDPVHEARIEKMKSRGEDWFGGYILPQAVLRLKQGVGRLIRSHEDFGVMAILDVRLHLKPYGRRVVAALPNALPVANIRLVEQFYTKRNRGLATRSVILPK